MHEQLTTESSYSSREADDRGRARQHAGAPAGAQRAGEAKDKDGATGAGSGALAGAALGAGVGLALGAAVGGGPGMIAGALIGAGIGAAAGAARTVVVNVTKLAGVSDTVSDDIALANTIFRQASIRVAPGKTETLPAATSQAILGPDNLLDDYTGSTLTAEETKLIAHNRTAGRITAYYVPRFSDPDTRGEAITKADFGVPDPSVVVAAQHHWPDTLAHELAHVLTDEDHADDASNLLATSRKRNHLDLLTQTQISKIQKSPYVK